MHQIMDHLVQHEQWCLSLQLFCICFRKQCRILSALDGGLRYEQPFNFRIPRSSIFWPGRAFLNSAAAEVAKRGFASFVSLALSRRVASRARFQVCREFHNSLTRVVESGKYKLCNQSRRNFDPLYSATSIKELRESQHSLSSQSLATRTSERAFEKVRCLPLTTDGWACRKSLLLPFGMTTQQCKFLYNRLREFRASFTQPLREKYALLGTGGTSRVSDSRLLPLEVGK